MATTAPAPNNKSVAFRGKAENEMPRLAKSKPVKSTARRAMKRGMISEKAAKKHLGGI